MGRKVAARVPDTNEGQTSVQGIAQPQIISVSASSDLYLDHQANLFWTDRYFDRKFLILSRPQSTCSFLSPLRHRTTTLVRSNFINLKTNKMYFTSTCYKHWYLCTIHVYYKPGFIYLTLDNLMTIR